MILGASLIVHRLHKVSKIVIVPDSLSSIAVRQL